MKVALHCATFQLVIETRAEEIDYLVEQIEWVVRSLRERPDGEIVIEGGPASYRVSYQHASAYGDVVRASARLGHAEHGEVKGVYVLAVDVEVRGISCYV